MTRHAWRTKTPVRIGAHVLAIVAVGIVLWAIGGSIIAFIAEGTLPPLSLPLFVIVISGTMLTLRQRLLARTATELLAEDPRPPILYFRPFRTDVTRILSRGGDGFEKRLEAEVSRIGPFVAVGNPDDRLPPAGAARLYVQPGADWKTEVERLLREAHFVIFRAEAEPSESVRWELERIVATVDPGNVLIALPRPTRKATNEALAYRSFVESVSGLFPQPFPPWRLDAPFLAFDSDWRPYWLQRGNSYLERNDDNNGAAATLRRWIATRG